MSAPERIWIEDERPHGGICFVHTEGTAGQRLYRVEYIRADLARPTLTHALELPEVAALVEALDAKTVMDPNNSNSTWLDAKARAALAALTTATADGGKP